MGAFEDVPSPDFHVLGLVLFLTCVLAGSLFALGAKVSPPALSALQASGPMQLPASEALNRVQRQLEAWPQNVCHAQQVDLQARVFSWAKFGRIARPSASTLRLIQEFLGMQIKARSALRINAECQVSKCRVEVNRVKMDNRFKGQVTANPSGRRSMGSPEDPPIGVITLRLPREGANQVI